MKFLLDVCVSSRSLTKLISDLGHDVRLAGDVDPRASDERILSLAREEGRILLTEEKDSGGGNAGAPLPVQRRHGRGRPDRGDQRPNPCPSLNKLVPLEHSAQLLASPTLSPRSVQPAAQMEGAISP